MSYGNHNKHGLAVLIVWTILVYGIALLIVLLNGD